MQASLAFLDPEFYIEKSFITPPSEFDAKLKKTVNFNFKKVNVSEILVLMSKVGDFNIVFPKNLDREVSLNIKDQSIKDTLEDLSILYGYEYQFKANSIVFKNKGANQQIQLIPLKYKSAGVVVSKLNELGLKNIKITKDPSLNNILLFGDINEIEKVQSFVRDFDKAAWQKVFLPEFLGFKEIQRFFKHNLNEKADLKVDRIEQDYILISGEKNLVNEIYDKLEAVDKSVPEQAFVVEAYQLTPEIEAKLLELDPKFDKKSLFRVDADALNFDSFALINSESLKLNRNIEANSFDQDFKYSCDILDRDTLELSYAGKTTYFKKNSDYAVYFMPKSEMKKNYRTRKLLGLTNSLPVVFVIKTITDAEFETSLAQEDIISSGE